MKRTIGRDIRIEQDPLGHKSQAILIPECREGLQMVKRDHAALLEHLHCLNYATHTAKTHAEADRPGSLLAWLLRQENLKISYWCSAQLLTPFFTLRRRSMLKLQDIATPCTSQLCLPTHMPWSPL
ncbi:hypothetical protein NDU88_007365 [Pleurodeles waltl]|uniref:Uncharacterized protein n=1 Tax=Pleurodeles waltl TaxID=8319 RepID=A0AAV7RSV5_PLEWA|nr:hypothetical protein NDU88_007365 [Pleurodeles waltl]